MISIVEDFPQIAVEMARLAALKAAGNAANTMAKAEEAAKPPKPVLEKLPWSFLPGMPHKPPQPVAYEIDAVIEKITTDEYRQILREATD